MGQSNSTSDTFYDVNHKMNKETSNKTTTIVSTELEKENTPAPVSTDTPDFKNTYIYDGEGEVKDKTIIRLAVKEGVEVIHDRTFFNYSCLTSIKLPESIQEIGVGAFTACYSLKSVDIPSVKVIRSKAFEYCTNLKSIHLPQSLQTIENFAFGDCESLQTIEIPQSVTTIHKGSFQFCTNLKSVTFPSSLEEIGDCAFWGCVKLTIVEVPQSTNIHKTAFHGCEMLNCGKNIDRLKGRFDKLPLHRLCHRPDLSLSKIVRYFDENHNIAYDTNLDGWQCSALHILAGNPHATSKMLQFLVKKLPTIVEKVDINGRTFLHYACENYSTFPVSRNLLHSKFHNGNFLLPKVDAYNDNVTNLAIRYINTKFVDKKMLVFSLYPLKEDAGNNTDERESIKELIAKRIDYKTNEEDFNEYSDLERCALVHYFNDLEDTNTIKKWEERFKSQYSVECVKKIAHFNDFKSRSMLSVAPLVIRNSIYDKILFLGKYKFVNRPLIYQSDSALVLEASDYKAEEYYTKLYHQYEDIEKKCITEIKFYEAMKDLVDNNDREQQAEGFKQWDIDGSGAISKTEFISLCQNTFGKHYNVVLKFMKNEKQYQNEIEKREELSKNVNIVKILQDYDFQGRDSTFKEEKNNFLVNYSGGNEFNFMIVMSKGDRNLDMISRCEKPCHASIVGYTIDICRGIEELHRGKKIHGDIKPQNFVRIGHKLFMIDLDASSYIDNSISCIEGIFESTYSCDYTGAKFSSGVLPPEMICYLTEENKDKFLNYFENLRESDNQMWNKIQPKQHKYKPIYYCVKTFLSDDDGTIQNIQGLPYTPIKANEAIDLWSLGTVLYKLLSGKSLFDTDKNEDLTSSYGFEDLYHWDDHKRDIKLRNITDRKAKSLLRTLLSKDPLERQNIEYVLKHAYVSTDESTTEKIDIQLEEICNKIDRIEKNTLKIMGKIDQSTTKLCNTIFQAAKTDIPTCFIITDHELEIKSELKDEGDTFGFMKSTLTELNEYAGSIENATDESEDSNPIEEFMENPMQCIGSFVGGYMNSNKDVYLYLVDEYSGEPVISRDNSAYPIQVVLSEDTTKSNAANYMQSILPVLIVGMRVLTRIDVGIGELLSGFEKSTDTFKIVDHFVAENQNKQTKVEGRALREFRDFLLKQDPNKDFCNLKRVSDADGNVIWTLPANAEKMKREGEQLSKMSISTIRKLKRDNEAMRKEIEELKKTITETTTQPEIEKEHQKECFHTCILS